jgi:hypothetical protein
MALHDFTLGYERDRWTLTRMHRGMTYTVFIRYNGLGTEVLLEVSEHGDTQVVLTDEEFDQRVQDAEDHAFDHVSPLAADALTDEECSSLCGLARQEVWDKFTCDRIHDGPTKSIREHALRRFNALIELVHLTYTP